MARISSFIVSFRSVPSIYHCDPNSTFVSLFFSAPLLSNLLPHLQKLLNFITNTIPKPLLVGMSQTPPNYQLLLKVVSLNLFYSTALMYRLAILHTASRVLPTIGADVWDDVDGVDSTWEGSRPVRHSFSTFVRQ